MGTKRIQLKIKTDYHKDELEKSISNNIRTREFTYHIANKSLDARNKKRIHWNITIQVSSKSISENEEKKSEHLSIPYKKRNKKVIVVGSGPAGFFAAYTLQLAGFETTLLERGHDVGTRDEKILQFEKTAKFSETDNYAFGEGGAGTFSDGKLTSRSKHINKEKAFIIDTYIEAGAPKEIAYLAHPHLGSDNLKKMMVKLRQLYEAKGGTFHFGAMVNDIYTTNNAVTGVNTNIGDFEADYCLFATGHSAYETYRMLIDKGVSFRTKNFAIGSRAEHPQVLINEAQWGRESLPGVKAAEYRLTHNDKSKLPVYTFCMCPGGMVVPATPYRDTNIVNGMSLYQRNNTFANAACVAGINLNTLLKKEVSALEAIDWLQKLEQDFYSATQGYKAPFCSIQDFLKGRQTNQKSETSYPFGMEALPLWELLPAEIIDSLRNGLNNFAKKLKGYDTGNLIGLESKTSAPIQIVQNDKGFCEGWKNLLIAGEGSGYSGGIISSAADGIRKAFAIVEENQGL